MSFSLIYQICRFPKSNTRCRYSVRKITYKESQIYKVDEFLFSERNLSKLHKEIQKMQCIYFLIDNYTLDNIGLPSI